MALFKVIKYDGDKKTLIYKHPTENMNTSSKLIVNGFQEAIFIKGGVTLDVLPQGTYVLTTDNIPLLSAFVNLPFGGKTPFTAEVFFVNKQAMLGIKWGTLTPLQLCDPKYGIIVPVRGYGQFGIKVADSKKLMEDLIGNVERFSTDDLLEYFKGILCGKINDLIAASIVKFGCSILDLNAMLQELSDEIKQRLSPTFESYGVELVDFSLISINVPEEDPSVIELKQALSKKASMNVIGYDYDKERTYDTLISAAQNEGSGNLSTMGMGIPIGVAVGEFLKESLKPQLTHLHTPNTQEKQEAGLVCPHCGTTANAAFKFCPTCGKSADADVALRRCPDCDEQVEAGVSFCPECGRKME